MLLALKPRLYKDCVILDAFALMYSSKLYASASAIVTECTELLQWKRCDASRYKMSRLMQNGFLKSSSLGNY